MQISHLRIALQKLAWFLNDSKPPVVPDENI